MATSFPMSLPHAPTGFVDRNALDAAFTTPVNDLYQLLASAAGLNIAVGYGTITPSDVNVPTTQAVSFPAGKFSVVPLMLITLTGGISSTVTCFLWANGTTTSGFTANVNRNTTTPTTYTWLAISP